MNIQQIRDNKNAINQIFVSAIYNGFERALIWQDENLDDFDGLPLDYHAKAKCEHTCNIFVTACLMNKKAFNELYNNEGSQIGHSLALQMLGHGVGFWDNDNTKVLGNILDLLLDTKSIKPFTLFHDVESNKLNWDMV